MARTGFNTFMVSKATLFSQVGVNIRYLLNLAEVLCLYSSPSLDSRICPRPANDLLSLFPSRASSSPWLETEGLADHDSESAQGLLLAQASFGYPAHGKKEDCLKEP